MTAEAKLGASLRALRRRHDWTLEDVHKKTGLSTSTISKVERNQLSLTYDKLVQLSQGLGVDITTFFEGGTGEAPGSGGQASRRSINRLGDGRVVETANYHHVYLSTDLLRKKINPILADIKARSLEEFGEMVRHAGEEFAYVVEGTVALHTEHYAPVILSQGESMYFDSGMAHAYVACIDGPCRVLSVCSAPEAEIEQAIAQGGRASRAATVAATVAVAAAPQAEPPARAPGEARKARRPARRVASR